MTLPPLQGFSSEETVFHLCQFLSNFLKYSFSNFPLFQPYSNFAIYFPGNSILLNSFAFVFCFQFTSSCLLTSAPILPLNSSTNSLACSRSSFLSHISFSTVNLFYHTRYFSTPLIFLLFNIFSTSHSSTPSTLIGLPSSLFYPFTCSLYHTIRLTFTTR